MCKETRFSCAFNADGSDSCFVGDVEATIDFGFASLKIDSCGIQRNMTEYARLFNESGHALVLENCHNGNPYNPVRGAHDNVECPMNLFRTSGDIRPQWGSILSNLMTTVEFNAGLSGPGCYGYPDMLGAYICLLGKLPCCTHAHFSPPPPPLCLHTRRGGSESDAGARELKLSNPVGDPHALLGVVHRQLTTDAVARFDQHVDDGRSLDNHHQS